MEEVGKLMRETDLAEAEKLFYTTEHVEVSQKGRVESEIFEFEI
jgi:hypothetical protein